ncbi:MAG: iron-sulfur cluster assembly scaffold protein [Alphaproteobacteria bacterium]|nr:iron-sulfur cluster assembly scaffold protein [Alphaproteobacteria bacterium]
MSDDLYQQAILEAARRGAENRRLDRPDGSSTVDNPLCGDRVTMDVCVRDGRIAAVGFRTRGCALCQASTALLADAAVSREPGTLARAEDEVVAMLGHDGPPPAPPFDTYAMFMPARRHPSRHTCVRLPFDALRQVLADATDGGSS